MVPGPLGAPGWSLLTLLACIALSRCEESNAWVESTNTGPSPAPLSQGPNLQLLVAESKAWADAAGEDRSGEGTEIQNAIKGVAGTLLRHMDRLDGVGMSATALTQKLQTFLSQPEALEEDLSAIRRMVPKHQLEVYELLAPTLDANALSAHIIDKLPHDGDKL